MEQIPESHYEKEEEEEEESVEIIQQANLNLDAPLMDAGSTDRAHMSSTTEQPTNSQEQDVKHDNDDGDDEDEDDDQLPETQPCF